MTTYSMDVDMLDKLYHLDVEMPNINETEGISMSTYLMDVNIPNKYQIYKGIGIIILIVIYLCNN